MGFVFGERRGVFINIEEEMKHTGQPLAPEALQHFETLDEIYRATCALCFNYVPTSGHPGGSISAGRTISALVFDTMDYDVSDPNREDADIISFAAGHKVLGLYVMWALRNEVGPSGATSYCSPNARACRLASKPARMSWSIVEATKLSMLSLSQALSEKPGSSAREATAGLPKA